MTDSKAADIGWQIWLTVK